MLHCCTYFDCRYLTRGLSLYRSLERGLSSFRLRALCLDEECLTALQRINLPHLELLSIAELEAHFPALRTARGNRSVFEYYATIKPFLIRLLFERDAAIDRVFFLDADFWFFADPSLLEQAMGDAAVLLSPHRLTPSTNAKMLSHGTFNAGFIAFRREGGLDPLRWWCERVLEWCGDQPKDDLFADQGYLDTMIRQFPGVISSQHPGINVAPWNLDERDIRRQGDHLLVGRQPLIFFHAHGVRRLAPWLYDTGAAPYRIVPPRAAANDIYLPYIRELRHIKRWLRMKYNYYAQEGSVRHAPPTILQSPGLLFSRIRRRQWIVAR